MIAPNRLPTAAMGPAAPPEEAAAGTAVLFVGAARYARSTAVHLDCRVSIFLCTGKIV